VVFLVGRRHQNSQSRPWSHLFFKNHFSFFNRLHHDLFHLMSKCKRKIDQTLKELAQSFSLLLVNSIQVCRLNSCTTSYIDCEFLDTTQTQFKYIYINFVHVHTNSIQVRNSVQNSNMFTQTQFKYVYT